MIRILDRLVAGTFVKLFLAFVLGAPLLFILGDVTEQLDAYLTRGITALDVAHAYVYMLPKFILWSFPIAALIAAVFTVHGMTVNREIVAAKAGGISFHRLILPLIVCGAVLTGVGLWLTHVVPTTNRIAAEILKERDARRTWRSNFVFQSGDGRSLSVRRLTVPNRQMNGVAIQSGDPTAGEAVTHVVASRGQYSPQEGWVLFNGYLRRLEPGGDEDTFRFERMRVIGLDEKPEELLEEPREEELMTYEEMGRLADIIRRSGGDPQQLLVEREQKLAIPVATLVIVLFGAPLATTAKRGGAAFGVGLSLGSTILYMLLFRVFGAIGESGGMSALAAAWAPNAIFLLTGLILLHRVRT